MAQNVGEIKAKISLDSQNFNRSLNEARGNMSEAEGGASGLATAMGGLERASIAVGTAVMTAAGLATNAAADFEQSMARVQAISGATGSDFEALEDAARQLGSETEFSAVQAAEGLELLGMAGFEAKESVEALPAVLDLAAAAQVDMGQSADIVSNIMQGFGLEAAETEGAVDVLVQTMTTANTDLPQLGQAMSMVAPIAHSLGLDIEDTAGAIAALSDAGRNAARAGNHAA